ncbi:hypothetical protein WOLCODRAFT_21411 [Wolfiporia cocos MD-104 SS10]|uniref:Uncharacterized protein n=1 Tax=Wolfiporia cocos (strain MD-104) TaxID=742152 RepID=A0A2H3JAK8_WOLCO|nr:hypothetical protein WOLCODRAFT_21411 [Wolfiporia cocos MD-104 SS10]
MPSDLESLTSSPSEHEQVAEKGHQGYIEYHSTIDGRPCDSSGTYLDPDTPPPQRYPRERDDYSPFRDRVEFETAEFLYKKNQMSGGDINTLMTLWAASIIRLGGEPPFADSEDLYSPMPEGEVPSWMSTSYKVWFRDVKTVAENMLSNPDFDGEIDYSPYREYDAIGLGSKQILEELQDIISSDPSTHGSMFCPIILGSDKTTVSVATGQNEYYPLYMSLGSVHNNVRRAHRNAVSVIGFLAIPKNMKFRKFRHQLFQSSLSMILKPLHTAMSVPQVTRCPDGHYRRVIYGLGPYIADYPEQALAACIVQGWCPTCTALYDALDGGPAPLRFREHTEELVESLDLMTLWNEYGIVGDIIDYDTSTKGGTSSNGLGTTQKL